MGIVWAVVRTHLAQERGFARRAEDDGYRCYLPQFAERVPRQKGEGYVRVRRVLFPSYVFVRLARLAAEYWIPLESIRGAVEVLKNEERPARVRAEELNRIRAMEDGNGLIQLRPPRTPGDKVVVARGAMKNFEGVYEGTDDAGRLSVLFSMLGRPVSVRLRENDLAAA